MARPLIIYLCDTYPSSAQPLAGLTYRDHARALSQVADVAVLSIEIPDWWQARRRKPEEYSGYEDSIWIWSGSWPVASHKFAGWKLKAEQEAILAGFHRVEREFGRRPDFLIAHNVLPAGRWARWIHENYGNKFGTIEHVSHLERMLKNEFEEIIKIYSKTSFIAGVSNSVKDLLIGYLPESMHDYVGVVGNVIGHEFQTADLKSPPEMPFRWLFIGDDTFRNGPELLHEVFSGLDHTDWQLTIVGDGDFNTLKNDNELKNNISFRPLNDRSEMVDILQNHHALISTSHVEPFGMPILEMMSAGRPVVSTRSGGPEDFVTEDCGILANVGNAEELGDAVNQLQKEYHKYDLQKIRDHALQRYGQRIYAERILNLIKVFT